MKPQRFAFLGGSPSGALEYELRLRGHEVLDDEVCHWWLHAENGVSEYDYEKKALEVLGRFNPTVLVLGKGYTFYKGRMWKVPATIGWRARTAGCQTILMCWDDPAATPLIIAEEIFAPYKLWLTSCPGIVDLFHRLRRSQIKVREFWLAFDTRITTPVEFIEEYAVDVAFTGSPYYKPFPAPHYQRGFSNPRRDLVRAALEAGFSVGLWGPETWLDPEQGGDPEFAPYFKGWISPTLVHRVHRAAKVCVATHLVEGWRYDSGRLPWVLGAGGCLLHESRPGLQEEFGGRVAWYDTGNVGHFTTRLRFLLENDAVREQMARDGQEYVLANHTWRNRAKQLEALLDT